MPRFQVRPGDWHPGVHNLALLVVQAIALYQVGFRGLDYLKPPPGSYTPSLNVVENSASLPVWGALFYGSAVLALIGLAGRWALPVIAGHVLLFCWYGGVGYGLLVGVGVSITWPLPLGAALAVAGVWLVFSRRPFRLLVRLLCGVPLMLAGQYISALDLGDNYRTGTGLITSGLIHLTLAVGTWALWQRQRLEAVVGVEEEAVMLAEDDARAERSRHRGSGRAE